MLLHASRLVVPRPGKQTIDITAPLPDYFGEWASFDKLRTGNAA
jgi:tRNA pseudouridine32 synthase/23S rRNA pseudouridine746 synthase